MQTDIKNRTAPSERNRGRPPESEPRQPERVAKIDLTQETVPPLTCPKCGRGMTPRVERWSPCGEAYCVCQASGCRFVYRPATTRVT